MTDELTTPLDLHGHTIRPLVDTAPVRTVTYQVPSDAQLMVFIPSSDGQPEMRPATALDLHRFGFVDPGVVYHRWTQWMNAALDGSAQGHADIRESPFNTIRYAVECALHYPHMPTQEAGADGEIDGEDYELTVREMHDCILRHADEIDSPGWRP